MFPISTGAPVEKQLAKFFFGFFAVMLLGFMTPEGRKRYERERWEHIASITPVRLP